MTNNWAGARVGQRPGNLVFTWLIMPGTSTDPTYIENRFPPDFNCVCVQHAREHANEHAVFQLSIDREICVFIIFDEVSSIQVEENFLPFFFDYDYIFIYLYYVLYIYIICYIFIIYLLFILLYILYIIFILLYYYIIIYYYIFIILFMMNLVMNLESSLLSKKNRFFRKFRTKYIDDNRRTGMNSIHLFRGLCKNL